MKQCCFSRLCFTTTPPATFAGLPIKAGYAGFMNGKPDGSDKHGSTHDLSDTHLHFDSGFNLQISDPIPSDLSFVSADKGGVDNGGVVEWSLQAGPVLHGTEFIYQWIAEVTGCSVPSIVNTAYANLLGWPVKSIGAQNIVDCADIATPVELVYFTARLVHNATLLEWQTGYELNNDRFEVQLSVLPEEEGAWVTIGVVQGAGSSSQTMSYTFKDDSLPVGPVIYYRLKQIELDGKHTYSPVRSVTPQGSELQILSMFPSPAQSQLSVVFINPSEGEVEVIVKDVLAKTVVSEYRSAHSGRNTLILEVGALPAGSYIVELRSLAGTGSDRKRFAKQ